MLTAATNPLPTATANALQRPPAPRSRAQGLTTVQPSKPSFRGLATWRPPVCNRQRFLHRAANQKGSILETIHTQINLTVYPMLRDIRNEMVWEGFWCLYIPLNWKGWLGFFFLSNNPASWKPADQAFTELSPYVHSQGFYINILLWMSSKKLWISEDFSSRKYNFLWIDTNSWQWCCKVNLKYIASDTLTNEEPFQ